MSDDLRGRIALAIVEAGAALRRERAGRMTARPHAWRDAFYQGRLAGLEEAARVARETPLSPPSPWAEDFARATEEYVPAGLKGPGEPDHAR